MSENKKCHLLLVLSFIVNGSIFSQLNTNSIYSHYGLGDINQSGFVQNRALGGLLMGMRQSNQINYFNPASYNSMDSISFIFDIGFLSDCNTVINSESSTGNVNSYFDHLAIAFPLMKTFSISTGIAPFSDADYETTQANQNGSAVNSYEGFGKLSRFYFGSAYGILNNHLNFGLNFSYIFNAINSDETTEYYDNTGYYEFVPGYFYVNTGARRNFAVKGVRWNFGIQGIKELPNDDKVIGGITFEPRTSLKYNYSEVFYPLTNRRDTLFFFNTSANLVIPARLGIGASLILKDKLLIGIDYSSQDWSKTSFPDQEATFDADKWLRFGIQFTPDSRSYRNYFKRINYRLGSFYGNTYLSLNGKPINDYGLTFGFGLPFNNNMVNISVEIGRRGTTSDDLEKTDYTRIALSLNLCK